MKGLQIAIILLFLTCFVAAGHGGGPFGMLEIALIANIGHNEALENGILMAIIILQIAWWVAIKQSNDRLMLGVVIVLNLIVIAATLISIDAIDIVIWPNALFLIVSVIYIIKYFKNIKEMRVIANEGE